MYVVSLQGNMYEYSNVNCLGLVDCLFLFWLRALFDFFYSLGVSSASLPGLLICDTMTLWP